MITALAVAYAAFVAHQARTAAKAAHATATESRDDIKKIEVNTNSMREQLVKATGVERFAAGKEEGRIEGEAKAAVLASGIALGIAEEVAKEKQT